MTRIIRLRNKTLIMDIGLGTDCLCLVRKGNPDDAHQYE